MPAELPHVLDYETPRPANPSHRVEWAVAALAGLIVGYLLSTSGFVIVCLSGAPFLGAFTALAASSRKILCGLVAVLIAVTCFVCCVAIREGGVSEDLIVTLPFLFLLLAVPCILGSLLAMGVDRLSK